MSQEWWTTAAPRPSLGDNAGGGIEDILGGIDTAITLYYGTTDPSSGASWDDEQLGALWLDATNELDEGGDDLGGVLKRWVRLTSTPTYGWQTMDLFSYVPVEPNSEALDVASQSTTAFGDLDLNSIVGDRAIRVRLLVEVADSGTPSSAVYAGFRKDGTTTDDNDRRVYPQAAGVPITQVVEVELAAVPASSTNKLEYEIAASGSGTFDLRITVLGYWERA